MLSGGSNANGLGLGESKRRKSTDSKASNASQHGVDVAGAAQRCVNFDLSAGLGVGDDELDSGINGMGDLDDLGGDMLGGDMGMGIDGMGDFGMSDAALLQKMRKHVAHDLDLLGAGNTI